MLIDNNRNPVNMPERAFSEPAPPKQETKAGDAFDLDKMLSDSNAIKQVEVEKEKNAVTDGEYHVGETKNDKEFREQLEKITGKKQEKAKNKLDQHDYLTLLVTQLKYQDPTKPMEHYEMASQMAQFNTVEQLVGVNKSLTNMNKAQDEAKLDKLSQYLDKFVEVQGNKLKLNSNKTTSIARFSLPTKASTVFVDIKDSQGKNVRSISLEETEIGSHAIEWDGKNEQKINVAPGDYTFVITAASDEGKPITAQTSFSAQVNGVTDLQKGGKLDTTAGPIDPEKVIAIRNYEQEKLKSNILPNVKGEDHGINK